LASLLGRVLLLLIVLRIFWLLLGLSSLSSTKQRSELS
jgi:hypothetical protein